MMYNFYLTVTQKWHTSVEADNYDEAIGLAKLAYDREPNPWDCETLMPIGDEVIEVEEARE